LPPKAAAKQRIYAYTVVHCHLNLAVDALVGVGVGVGAASVAGVDVDLGVDVDVGVGVGAASGAAPGAALAAASPSPSPSPSSKESGLGGHSTSAHETRDAGAGRGGDFQSGCLGRFESARSAGVLPAATRSPPEFARRTLGASGAGSKPTLPRGERFLRSDCGGGAACAAAHSYGEELQQRESCAAERPEWTGPTLCWDYRRRWVGRRAPFMHHRSLRRAAP